MLEAVRPNARLVALAEEPQGHLLHSFLRVQPPDSARLQPLDQTCLTAHGVALEDRLKLLVEFCKDLVVDSTTVDQGLIISTVKQEPES